MGYESSPERNLDGEEVWTVVHTDSSGRKTIAGHVFKRGGRLVAQDAEGREIGGNFVSGLNAREAVREAHQKAGDEQ